MFSVYILFLCLVCEKLVLLMMMKKLIGRT